VLARCNDGHFCKRQLSIVKAELSSKKEYEVWEVEL